MTVLLILVLNWKQPKGTSVVMDRLWNIYLIENSNKLKVESTVSLHKNGSHIHNFEKICNSINL